ncbi:MAG: PorT family protein [Bacteroidales bacterium]|nr:PorT family protein [Bacteroidales bacterium]
MGSAAENFDAWFREKLEHYEESPGAEAWENISEKLGHSRKKRVLVFLLRIAAGMILTLSLGLGYYYYSQQRAVSVQPSVTETLQQADQPSDSPIQVGDNEKGIAYTSPIKKSTDAPAKISDKGTKVPATGYAAVTPLTDTTPDEILQHSACVDAPLKLHSIFANLHEGTSIPEMVVRPGNKPVAAITETDLIAMNNIALMKAEEEDQKRKKDWILSGQVAPLYSYRRLSSDNLSGQDINELNNAEEGILAYAGGLAMAFAPTKRLSVQTGIYYSKYGQEKTELNPVVYDNDNKAYYTSDPVSYGPGEELVQPVVILNSTGTIVKQESGNGSLDIFNTITQEKADATDVINVPVGRADEREQITKNMTARQYFEYLEVPIILRYKIIDRKLDLHLMGGISTNFLVGNRVQIDDDGEKYDYGKTNDISTINYSGSVGIGFEYPVLTNLLFNLEPKFRYYLNSMNTNDDLDVHPYSIGIFAGISYVF